MNNSKKWCEICKILVPYSRAAILDHENSAKHKKNKEISLINQNKQARKEHKAQNRAVDVLPKHVQQQAQEEQVTWDHYNQENNRETQQQQKQVADQMAFFGEGKIWILEKEDDGGQLRFRNTITGSIQYEKPMGLQLEDFEEEAWEQWQLNKGAGPQLNKNLLVKIGQWEVVQQDDAFLNKYKAESDEEEHNEEIQKQLDDKIKLRIQDGGIKQQADYVKEILTYGSVGPNKKQMFGQKLIELAEKDIELNDAVLQIGLHQQQDNKINTQGLFKKRVKQNQE